MMMTSSPPPCIGDSVMFLLHSLVFALVTLIGCVATQLKVAKVARKYYTLASTWSTVVTDREASLLTTRSTGVPLFDWGHQLLNPILMKMTRARDRDDFCSMLDSFPPYYGSATIAAALLNCFMCIEGGASKSLEDLGYATYTISILAIIRCVVYSLTILPQCDYRPKKMDARPDATPVELVIDFFTWKNEGELGFRNDLMFSGHVSFCAICTLFIGEMLSKGLLYNFHFCHMLVMTLCWIGTTFVAVGSVAMKKHYTIDVLFAYPAAYLAYWCCQAYRIID
jgi:hypothetical protein